MEIEQSESRALVLSDFEKFKQKRIEIGKKQNFTTMLVDQESADQWALNRGAHHLILGMSGSGKTFSTFKWMLTDIASGVHHTVIIDQEGGISDYLLKTEEVKFALDQGRFHYVSPENPSLGLNILDPRNRVKLKDIFLRVDSTALSDAMNRALEAIEEGLATVGGSLMDFASVIQDSNDARKRLVKMLFERGEKEKARNLLDVLEKGATEKKTWNGLLSRVHKLINHDYVKDFLCNLENTFDIRRLLTGKQAQVILINLEGGGDSFLHPAQKSVIGQVCISLIQLVGMKRRGAEKKQIFLYADEMQEFTSEESIREIVLRARQHKLSGIFITQGLNSLSNSLQNSILDAVNVIQCFNVSDSNANIMNRTFGLNRRDSEEGLKDSRYGDNGAAVTIDGREYTLTMLPKYVSLVRVVNENETEILYVDGRGEDIFGYSIGMLDRDLRHLICMKNKSPLFVLEPPSEEDLRQRIRTFLNDREPGDSPKKASPPRATKDIFTRREARY